MKEYEKIEILYLRDEKTKRLTEGLFRNKTIEFLKDIDWEFTEKIDGTNIRICWDGHKVEFKGRTDNAQIPSQLLKRLIELFGGEVNEQMFEQKFGETPVMLIGEGYGAKIQKGGGDYRDDNDFILFDVCVNDTYLERENVKDIAKSFNIDVVPTIMIGTIQDAVDYVKTKPMSKIGKAKSEGLVGRPLMELKDRQGKRLIVKIKVRDFEG